MVMDWSVYRGIYYDVWTARKKTLDWIKERWAQEFPDRPWESVGPDPMAPSRSHDPEGYQREITSPEPDAVAAG